MLANPPALEGNRGPTLNVAAKDNIDEQKVVIICDDKIDVTEENCEPPTKKLKCKPSSSGSLNGHLVVIQDPFKSPVTSSQKSTLNENQNSSKTSPEVSQSPSTTPKQTKLMEKQLLREQKERDRLLAQEKKYQEKIAKQKEKELKELERQEKKALELKEKEERQKQREEEKQKRELLQQLKDSEKKQREELKRKKDEERNQELEAKRQKLEEEEKKKNKARESFKSFFIAKRPSPKSQKPVNSNAMFQPFELKPGMSLAPCKRSIMKYSPDDFDNLCRNQDDSNQLYLKEHSGEWKKNRQLYFVTRKSLRESLKVNERREEDCVMVENEDEDNNAINNEHQPKSMTAKLLQFHTNTRPAYYGTWQKKSKGINGRHPFYKDENLLEYDFESDDEWEEEEPGESLSGPEDDEEENNDPDEADGDEDGFFVPHGYLSDDEGLQSDEGEKESKSETEKCSYELDWDKKCKALRPVFVYRYPTKTLKDDLPAILNNLKIEIIAEMPISIERTTKTSLSKKAVLLDGQETAIKSVKRQCYPVPEEAMPHLIRHVHKSRFGINKLIVSFLKDWNNIEKFTDLKNREPISKRQLERKILTIANREQTEQIKTGLYMVYENVLKKYNIDHASIETQPNDSL